MMTMLMAHECVMEWKFRLKMRSMELRATSSALVSTLRKGDEIFTVSRTQSDVCQIPQWDSCILVRTYSTLSQNDAKMMCFVDDENDAKESEKRLCTFSRCLCSCGECSFFCIFFSPIKTYNFYTERNDFSFQSEISPCNRIFSSEVVCDKYQVCIRVAQTVRCQIPLWDSYVLHILISTCSSLSLIIFWIGRVIRLSKILKRAVFFQFHLHQLSQNIEIWMLGWKREWCYG